MRTGEKETTAARTAGGAQTRGGELTPPRGGEKGKIDTDTRRGEWRRTGHIRAEVRRGAQPLPLPRGSPGAPTAAAADDNDACVPNTAHTQNPPWQYLCRGLTQCGLALRATRRNQGVLGGGGGVGLTAASWREVV